MKETLGKLSIRADSCRRLWRQKGRESRWISDQKCKWEAEGDGALAGWGGDEKEGNLVFMGNKLEKAPLQVPLPHRKLS